MKNIGIFYGSSSGKTGSVAEKILEWIGDEKARIHDIAEIQPVEILRYDFLLFGVPTWGIGELQDDWARFSQELGKMDLAGKRVALFGLGDQESYPDSFCDALGEVYEILKQTGCEMTGSWPAEGFELIRSKARRGDEFVGLVLDEENQPEETDKRIGRWLGMILPGS